MGVLFKSESFFASSPDFTGAAAAAVVVLLTRAAVFLTLSDGARFRASRRVSGAQFARMARVLRFELASQQRAGHVYRQA